MIISVIDKVIDFVNSIINLLIREDLFSISMVQEVSKWDIVCHSANRNVVSSFNSFATVGQFIQNKIMQKMCKMTGTLANWYSLDSIQKEHSNEYQHDRVKIVFKHLCSLVPRTKVASASKGLRLLT